MRRFAQIWLKMSWPGGWWSDFAPEGRDARFPSGVGSPAEVDSLLDHPAFSPLLEATLKSRELVWAEWEEKASRTYA
ncbi:MAG: hypothetical protein U0931_35495 [Vulcanimicrobiota bacterium]